MLKLTAARLARESFSQLARVPAGRQSRDRSRADVPVGGRAVVMAMAAAMDGFGTEGLDFPTETSLEQWKLEHVARDIYRRSVASARIREEEDPTEECVACEGGWEASVAVLHRETHVAYLTKSLRHLSAGHVVLDASRCWLCYWIVHALALLGEPLGDDAARDVVEFLSLCQHPDGGFGGGPGQMPHLAPTYAAVACLAEIATLEAVECVDRAKCVAFLARCKDTSTGGYRMHEGGETDTRGCYTALAVARLLGVGSDAELRDGVGAFVAKCQTHEGGVAGEPGAEAHGGYTYCGLAAAVMCDSAHLMDLPELTHWLAHRQGAVEGGFNGRTNKLVDGCYSFWQGGAFPVLELASGAVLRAMGGAEGGADRRAGATRERRRGAGNEGGGGNEGGEAIASDASSNAACALFPAAQLATQPTRKTNTAGSHAFATPSFSSRALQGWLLLCCQLPNGGLQDKPGKGRDHYHTCYCLSGLSVAQHWGGDGLVGPATNLLERTDPLVNVTEARLAEWTRLVAQLPKI